MKISRLRWVTPRMLSLLFATLVLICGAMFTLPSQARPNEQVLGLELFTSEKISGFKGSKRKLILDNDLHGLDGISLAERKDNPCWIRVSTQNINDAAVDGQRKDLCGGKAKSRKMKVRYRDNMRYGERVFVTGVRVCTNKKQKRIKGIQLAGKTITSDGTLAELGVSSSQSGSNTRVVSYRLSGGGGKDPITEAIQNIGTREEYRNNPKNPADWRNNCDNWQKWAFCPGDNQIGVGVVAHFEAGKEPRSITGLELLCRGVWNTGGGTGAVPKS